MRLVINELEALKEVSNNKASQIICYKLQVTSYLSKLNLSCFYVSFMQLLQAKANMDELSCQISAMEVKMKNVSIAEPITLYGWFRQSISAV